MISVFQITLTSTLTAKESLHLREKGGKDGIFGLCSEVKDI
jgi:hypothetical protein